MLILLGSDVYLVVLVFVYAVTDLGLVFPQQINLPLI